jgi:hypothetical protein
MRGERRSDFIAIALLAGLPLILFADVLLGASDFFIRDVTRYYRPAKFMLRNIVLGGDFPYWNPWMAAGQPMAANPEHAVFYPPNWLVLLPDFNTGFRILILLHVVIAGVAMYALLRSMRCAPPAAFAAAAAYGLGGLYLSYINLLPILFSAAWVPLVCLYARRFLGGSGRWRDFALASLFLGLQFLSGEPSTMIQTAILVCAYAVKRAIDVRAMRPVLFAAALGVAGLFAGAAQMLPGIDHASETIRARGLPFESMSKWSMPPVKVAELVYPNLLGHVIYGERLLYWGGTAAYGDSRPPYLFSIYVGLVTAVMAATGFIARARGWRFTVIVAALFFFIAMGANTPLLRMLYDAGVAGGIRFYEKFAFGAVFVIIVFAARTLDRIADARLRRIAAIIAAALTVFAACVAAIAKTGFFARLFMRFHELEPSPLVFDVIGIAQRDWIFAAVRAAALLAILIALPRLRSSIAAAAIGAFVLADLIPQMREVTPTTSSGQFEGTPRVAEELKKRGERFRVFHEADWMPGSEAARQYQQATGVRYDRARQGLFPLIPGEFGIATVMELDYDLTALMPTADFVTSARELRGMPGWPQPFAAMSNAWYRGVYRPFERELARAGGDPRNLRPVAFIALAQQPRYYFADRLVTIRNREDFVREVSTNQHGRNAAFVPIPSFPPAGGIVRSVTESANRIRIDVESMGRAFLVMSVTTHQYWRAEIDGRDAPLVVTNIGYQGLEIPRGAHTVTMRYRNPLVDIGAAVSALTILVLAVLVWRGRQPC